jgi:hypothetical protein
MRNSLALRRSTSRARRWKSGTRAGFLQAIPSDVGTKHSFDGADLLNELVDELLEGVALETHADRLHECETLRPRLVPLVAQAHLVEAEDLLGDGVAALRVPVGAHADVVRPPIEIEVRRERRVRQEEDELLVVDLRSDVDQVPSRRAQHRMEFRVVPQAGCARRATHRRIMRCQFTAKSGKIESSVDLPNQMIFGDSVAKMKLVEQLTLVTLQTAHHGSTSPRIASTQRNHASPPVSTFATKSVKSCPGRRLPLLLQQRTRHDGHVS